MNLEKIGKFIAECRKQKKLTQLQLAETLYVTDRAVSKWETGKSLPDSSIMLDLCKCLDITVIDLLNGEKISMENCCKEAEDKLLQMVKEKEESDKRLLNSEIVFMIMICIPSLAIMILADVLDIENWLRAIIICGGVALMLFAALFALRIEQKAGYYVCPHCGHKYVPTYKTILFAGHVCRTRYMKCPNCGKRGWHKKAISKK